MTQHHAARILITAGPTHEPIDSVRFIGNRSSGKLGCALADEAARRGHPTTLLLGPCCARPTEAGVSVRRFTSCADLSGLLGSEAPAADIVVMAAAVADYRPAPPEAGKPLTKIRRTDAGLTLRLEPTPDLLAGLGASRRGSQLLIGFALEPAAGLAEAARAKMMRKQVGMIVANPLETMESDGIDAMVLWAGGRTEALGVMPKDRFAAWLVEAAVETWRGGSAAGA